MLNEPSPRHRLFEAARRRAELTVQELWLDYLSLGGTGDVFDVDAYLQGMGPLAPDQQDVLACALNECLEGLYRSVRVPYVTLGHATANEELPSAVLEQLLGDRRRPRADP